MSKFISKETKGYLESIAGNNVQQQIQNIKERIDLEANDLDQLIKNVDQDKEDLIGRIHRVSCSVDLIHSDQLTSSKDFSKLVKRVNYLTIGLIVVGVVVLCLTIKSLI